jgi:hypothetical protein
MTKIGICKGLLTKQTLIELDDRDSILDRGSDYYLPHQYVQIDYGVLSASCDTIRVS